MMVYLRCFGITRRMNSYIFIISFPLPHLKHCPIVRTAFYVMYFRLSIYTPLESRSMLRTG